MSYAEQLIAEGRTSGWAQGKMEGNIEGKLSIARKLLAQGAEISYVSKLVELPMAQIKALLAQETTEA